MKTFFSLLRKELKQSLGFGILTLIYVVFARLIPFISGVTNNLRYYETNPTDRVWQQVISYVNNAVSSNSFTHLPAVILPAALLAIVFCTYLHSRKTADFYNSLPVKKTTVFSVKYLCGIIIFALAYGVNYIFMLIASVSMGVLTGKAALIGLGCLVQGILGFWLIYSSCFLAGLLTASVITQIVMAAIINGILPTIFVLKTGVLSCFYMTYIAMSDEISDLSPVVYFIKSSSSGTIKSVIILAAASVVFAVVCFFISKIRPAEASEKALAFKRTAAPLRVIFSFICGVIGGFVLQALFNIDGIAVFAIGLFAATIISSIIIEIIFSFDFTAALKKKRCLLIAVIADAVFAAVILSTVKPYNTYVPAAEEIEYAAICMNELASDESYKLQIEDVSDYLSDRNMESYNGEKLYEWSWYRDNAFDNMRVTDGELVHNVLDVFSDDYEGVAFTLPDVPADRENLNSYSIFVKCVLKNGREYYRSYYMRLYDLDDYAQNYTAEEKIDAIRTLLNSEEYKKGFYSNAFDLEPEDIKAARIANNLNFHEDEKLALDDEQAERLLTAVKNDLMNTTYDQIVTENPYGTLELMTKYTEKYDSYYTGAEVIIYSSYEETMSVLKDIGFKIYSDEEIIEDIEKITLSPYPDENNYSQGLSKEYIDKTQIAEIYYSFKENIGRMITVPSENLDVSIKSVYSEDSGNFSVKKPSPNFVAEDLNMTSSKISEELIVESPLD
ncbi:MAG: ABC transporter permease [Clostridiales bacterium]|nr:ABC transporter permease [Clostridiales bacterium]